MKKRMRNEEGVKRNGGENKNEEVERKRLIKGKTGKREMNELRTYRRKTKTVKK